MADDVRFKMADWQPFCFAISFFAHNSKTNRDIVSVVWPRKGFGGMANLVVIWPMMSDSKNGRLAAILFHNFDVFCS
jgi:hypothetical protein